MGLWGRFSALPASTRALLLASLALLALALTAAPASAFLTRHLQTQVGGFAKPVGVSVDPADNVWVTDPGIGAVKELSPYPANVAIGEQTGEGHFAKEGHNIASAARGANERLYVGDYAPGPAFAGRVQVFDPAGHWEATWTGFGNVGNLQVAVDDSGTASDGTVYAESPDAHVLKALTAAGAPANFSFAAPYIAANQITGTPTGPGEAVVPFGKPASIAVGTEGDLFIADEGLDAVDQFAPSGEFVRQLRSTPEGPFGSVASVGIDPSSGNVLVGDQGRGAIDEFSAAGAFVGETTGVEGGLRALAADSAGNLYVTDAATASLDVYSPAGIVPLSILSSSASGVSSTAATLETEINPHGLPTTYRFEYDTAPYIEGEPGHGTATPEASAGENQGDVFRSAQIQGLAPDTTYHFRVVAENSLGAAEGPDRAFTTQPAFPAGALLDNRAWELVSPPDKHGAPLEAITAEGGLIQAAADGSAVTYIAKGPVDEEPAGNRAGTGTTQQLLSTRAPTGSWSTADIATAHQAAAGVAPGNPSEYKLFSSDLSLGAVEPEGATPLSPLTSEKTPYLRQPDGEYTPLVIGCPAPPQPCPEQVAAHANVPPGTEFAGTIDPEKPELFGEGVNFVTATPDFSHLVLTSPVDLVEGFQNGGRLGLYEWSEGHLEAISVLPDGEPAGAEGSAQMGNGGFQMRNALSADGTRTVFRTSAHAHLYLRDTVRQETVQLDAPQPGAEGGPGEALFQTASADGSRVFFTDASRLTEDSTAAVGKRDLYMCQMIEAAGHLACDLRDLSVDHNPGEAANVQGAVIGAAEDGSQVYFVANGALTAGAVHGDCGAASGALPSQSCNLYRYDVPTELLHLVVVLSRADIPELRAGASDGQHLGALTSRVSPNGRYLAFMSQRPLTGYDNRDAASGARDQEVFLYDAEADSGAGGLICASCNPSGARPRGIEGSSRFPGLLVDRPQLWEVLGKNTRQTLAASIPGWTQIALGFALYQSRYLSDSGRLFFNAADALSPADTNGTEDVYEYEPAGVGSCTASTATYSPASSGCVSLISSGTSAEESAFMDASESGDDVFFLTASRLTPRDLDGALDLYDARVGGGEAEVAQPVECSGDACQAPAVPPNDQTPGSLSFQGAGNVVQCPKGKVKKSGKCVKQKAKKRHAKKHKGAKARHGGGGH